MQKSTLSRRLYTSLALKARDAVLKLQKYVPFLHRKPAAQRTLLHSKALSPEESAEKADFDPKTLTDKKLATCYFLGLPKCVDWDSG